MAKKILIIDDSTTVRQQVRAALASASFEVVEAADGVEGLEAITERQDLGAVLCDVNMPRMGGLEMLEMLQAKGKLDGLPSRLRFVLPERLPERLRDLEEPGL